MSEIEKETRPLQEGGDVEIIYLNDRRTRNSLSAAMGEAFSIELEQLRRKAPAPRALIITGKNNIFSSGGDFQLLRSFADRDPQENESYMKYFYQLFLRVRQVPFPTIAAVNGHAVGAALALALACDIRYFDPDGKYAFNFVKIGIHPGMGSSFLLKEIGGLAQAQELLLTGRYFSGREGLERGLCHRLFAPADVLEAALATAAEIGRNSPLAVALCKQGLYRNTTMEQALEYEAQSQARNYASADFREAMEAISAKREPQFRDQ